MSHAMILRLLVLVINIYYFYVIDNLYHELVDFQLFSPWTKLPISEQNKDLCFVLFSRIKSIPTIEKSVTVNVQGVSTFAVNGKLIEIIESGIEVVKTLKHL